MRSVDAELRGNLGSFGARIGSIRSSLGLSRMELAELSGIHVNTVVNIERGFVDGSILAASLMLMSLGCEGVEITGRGFEPIHTARARGGAAFPGLTTNKALMAAEIGGVIKGRRLGLGASVEELAERSGIHRNTLGNVEKGIVAPSIATVYRIYRSLEVSSVVGTNEGIRLLD